MPLTDLSLANPSILKFFEKKGSYVPSSELVYIHTHPLVKPNFLADIEVMVNKTAELMISKSMTGKPVDRFTVLATKLGRALPNITNENAPEILEILRDVYRLCNQITESVAPRAR